MTLRVLALGTRMSAWVDTAFNDYAQRMPREWAITLTELKGEKREGHRTPAQLLALEATRIRLAWSRDDYKVVLDERGEQWTTATFARKLASAREQFGQLCFVIGSADGLDDGIKREANVLMGVSSFTLPHGLVRVILAEQLYRAVTLLQGHPYHRV